MAVSRLTCWPDKSVRLASPASRAQCAESLHPAAAPLCSSLRISAETPQEGSTDVSHRVDCCRNSVFIFEKRTDGSTTTSQVESHRDLLGVKRSTVGAYGCASEVIKLVMETLKYNLKSYKLRLNDKVLYFKFKPQQEETESCERSFPLVVFCSKASLKFQFLLELPFPIVCIVTMNDGVYTATPNLISFSTVHKLYLCEENFNY